MDHPELLYYAALALVALPSIPFNRQAAVVIMAWLVGQFGYLTGLPVDAGDLVGYGLAVVVSFWLAARSRFSWSVYLIAALFVPLFVVALMALTGEMHPYYAYWYSFWLCMAQMVFIVLGNDWALMREGWHCMKDDKMFDTFLRTFRWIS